MRQRAGVTLTEVLIAIFVMAIGLLALLVLFPVGALNMAQAIKDDQTGHLAADAKTIANIWDIRHDSMLAPFAAPAPATSYTSFWQSAPGNTNPSAFTSPGPTPIAKPTWTWGCSTTYTPVTTGAGYPVYIDPFGYRAYGGTSTSPPPPLGGTAVGIPRVMPRFLQDVNINPGDPGLGTKLTPTTFNPSSQNYEINRWFSMLDNLNFNDNGLPDSYGAGTVIRDTRYSYAILARMPQVTSNNTVDLTVVVYNKRALATDLNGNPATENAYTANFPTAGSGVSNNIVSILYGAGAKPNVRPGSWILDATYVTDGKGNVINPPAGDFYRVVNVSDPGYNGDGTMDLELQVPLRNSYPTGANTVPIIVLLDDVAEVFEMGSGS